ncbi:phosphonoacetaldehyde hydrolase [Pelagibius sp.]|uniref:phosphonoacetaldehyde hydrolase n=1 Tax=Pelagibius sp. TaxID=1931238 RepID=UPI002620B69D|nr:phosphonoacetaldehyde hydrolase [Pelagibius sp.]
MSLVKAVVFDWAGTMIDFGSRAPMGAFVEVFGEFGVELTIAEARGPMGLPKLEHIKALGALPRVAAAWQEAHGGAPFDDDAAQRVYEIFVPLNARIVSDYADLVPGAAAMVADLRALGVKIGSTTGYTRDIMAPVLPLAADQGYTPDNLVCAGDLPAGRPSPLMMYKCFIDLAVWPASACVKVDDTEPGIAEGRAAGSWTVGVSLSGNEVGLSPTELAAAPAEERAALNARAVEKLEAAGADYVVDTVADLPGVLDRIEARIAAGESPGL